MAAPTTEEIGIAICDALDMLDGIEMEGADGPEQIEIDHMDDEDPSNLRIIAGGAVFVVRIIREG